MKILHVAALPFPSNQGTQVYIRQMCENQARRGHEIHLLTYSYGMTGHGPDGYRLHRLSDFPRFRSLRSGPAWQKVILDFRLSGKVRRLLEELEPDVIHAHHYEALAAALPANRGRFPLVYHAHTLLEPELPCYMKGRLMRATAGISGLAADRFLPGLARVNMTISPYLSEALIAHGVSPARVCYVPPALKVDNFDGEVKKSTVSEGADFIYVGNLDAYQGIDDLLEGIARLVRRGRQLSVKIVTDSNPGGCFGAVERLGISRNVSFEPHGAFSSVVGRLRVSKIALVPRKIPGGFPMKLINCLHLKKPVIASVHGSGGLRHGKEALLYGSVEDFVECADGLLSDSKLRKRMALAGFRFAKERFSWARSLDIMDEAYGRL